MKHFTYSEWLIYVKDDVNEKTRTEMEDHLYMCDQCLGHYLQAMEANESSFPILSNESNFTNLVMAGISNQRMESHQEMKNQIVGKSIEKSPDAHLVVKVEQNAPSKAKKPFYQQAVFHYLLAAAATILLTFSGVFHSIATYAGVIESLHYQDKRPSVTEGVINKTFAWMDSLEKKEVNKK